jgi:hypothetical protein
LVNFIPENGITLYMGTDGDVVFAAVWWNGGVSRYCSTLFRSMSVSLH